MPFSSQPTLPLVLTLALLLVPALSARADITLGGNARAIAMGGAGLASGDASEGAALNPALLADAGARMGIEWPTITTTFAGGSYADAFRLVGNPVLSAGDAANFATTLGSQNITMDASGSVGLLLPNSDFRANAALRVKILPNAAFQDWEQHGGTLSPDARADAVGVGMANWPSFGMGFYLPVNPQTTGMVAMGMRFKRTQVYYTHYIIDAATVAGGAPTLAPEMQGMDSRRTTSFSADLGFTYMPANTTHMRYAFVIDDLVQPKTIQFPGPTPAFLPADRQVLPRSYSLGTAYVDDNLTLAADWVDLSGAYDRPQIRLGIETRLPNNLALRGGYNSTDGFTVGVGWGDIGLAYSAHAPMLISESIAF